MMTGFAILRLCKSSSLSGNFIHIRIDYFCPEALLLFRSFTQSEVHHSGTLELLLSKVGHFYTDLRTTFVKLCVYSWKVKYPAFP